MMMMILHDFSLSFPMHIPFVAPNDRDPTAPEICHQSTIVTRKTNMVTVHRAPRNQPAFAVSFLLLCVYAQFAPTIEVFRGVESFGLSGDGRSSRPSRFVLGSTEKDEESSLSNYKDSDGASKGIVGSLTGIVNKVSSVAGAAPRGSDGLPEGSAPKSAEELLDRIRKDYVDRNYLWTGDLDLDCFVPDCVFTDPTISFVGTDKFTENTQNLVPIVEAFAQEYRSDLLSIELGSGKSSMGSNDGDGDEVYVETRWNMVGSLTASPWLFWKPKIDVIGRTKFWFRKESSESDDSSSTSGYKVYFYDESWEVPAWKALLQIVTPAGTFPSTGA